MSTRRIDHFSEGHDVPWTTGYTVRVTNGFTGPLPMVHVRAARRRRPSSVFRFPSLASGATAAFPVGTVDDLGFYEIAAYDEKGHAVARLPSTTGAITPVEAAAALPARPDEHTDDWVIDDHHLLDANAQYEVEVLNNTPDTWDEVTLFYASATDGTIGLASSAVSPQGKARFGLGPAGAMDGYVFSVWVDGLRAELSPGALQFPAEGLMTAERAAMTNGNMHPTRDGWAIGDGA
jgi:hypothetical protein